MSSVRPFAYACLLLAVLPAVTAAAAGELEERLAALEQAEAAAQRERLAAELAREPRARARLARMAAETRDARLRSAICHALAAEAGKSGLGYLQRLHELGDDAAKVVILRALRASPHDARTLYASFARPHLDANDPAQLQTEALRLLAAKEDPRYFEHLGELFDQDSLRGARNELVSLAAAFDDVRALEALLPFVEARLPRAEDSFLQHMPRMRSEAVGRWMRRKGLRHFDAVVRRTALQQIQRTVVAADLELLHDATRDEEAEVAAEAVRAIALLPDAEAADTLLEVADRGRPHAAATALRALFARKDGRQRALDFCLETIASYRAPELRIAAMDLAQESHAIALESQLRAAARDQDPRVRIAAYRALTFVRQNRSVDFLLERLALEVGTAQFFLLEALRDLTGYDQGGDPNAWFTWWELAKESFVVPPKPDSRTKRGPVAPGRTVAQYYGIDIVARRMAFIIDLSGSMSVKVEGETRLAHAKKELIAALEKLPKESWFNIVPFSDDPTPWQPRLVPATPQNVRAALDFVRGLRIGGWTNIYDSLELCLEMEGIESIFLLSDGGPSVGKFVVKPAIRSEVRDRNRERRVRVHTIMIGGSKSDRDFMRRLAEENFGQSVDQ